MEKPRCRSAAGITHSHWKIAAHYFLSFSSFLILSVHSDVRFAMTFFMASITSSGSTSSAHIASEPLYKSTP
jgi:hypothetical protein